MSIPFIIFKNDKFEINQDAIDFILSIKESYISIISIVGKQKSGKSFLINKLLNLNAFSTSSSVNTGTKGIWIYPYLIDHPQNKDIKLIVIDTEGLATVQKNMNYDGKINLIAFLMTTLFVYNSFGQLDEISLQNVCQVIEMANKLEKDFQKPDLLWVLRDFALKLVDHQGLDIDSNKYLQNSIQKIQGDSDVITKKNHIRQQIHQFFSQKFCKTIVRPVEDEIHLQNLNTLGQYINFKDDSLLRDEFKLDLQKIRELIYDQCQIRYFMNKRMDGQQLIIVIQKYIDDINQGELPNIKNIQFYLEKVEKDKQSKQIMEETDQILQCDIEDFEIKKQNFMQKIEQINDEKITQQLKYKFDQHQLQIEQQQFQKIKNISQLQESQLNDILKMKWMVQYVQKLENEMTQDKQLQNELDNVKDQLVEKTNKYQTIFKENIQFQQQLKQYDLNKEQVNDQNEFYKQQIQELKNQIIKNNNQQYLQDQNLNQQQVKFQQQLQQQKQLEDELQLIKNQLHDSKIENETLKQKLQKFKASFEEINQQFNQLTQQNQNQNKLQYYIDQIQELQINQEKLLQQIEQQNEENYQLKLEIKALKDDQQQNDKQQKIKNIQKQIQIQNQKQLLENKQQENINYQNIYHQKNNDLVDEIQVLKGILSQQEKKKIHYEQTEILQKKKSENKEVFSSAEKEETLELLSFFNLNKDEIKEKPKRPLSLNLNSERIKTLLGNREKFLNQIRKLK